MSTNIDPNNPEGQDPGQEPAAPNPWQRLVDAGIDPNDPHLLDRLQWGGDILDHSRRSKAVAHLLEQDPTIKDALTQYFQPAEPAPDHTPPWATEPDPEGDAPTGPSPQELQEYVRQEAERVAQEKYAEFEQSQQEQRLMDAVTAQVTQLGQAEGLSQQQQEEVWGRAWADIQAGRVDEQGFPTLASKALQDIRGLWAPPPPADPGLEAAQRFAQRPQAGMVAAGQGAAPSGDQQLENVKDSASLARRLIAENQGNW
jgi:hypothetical protein